MLSKFLVIIKMVSLIAIFTVAISSLFVFVTEYREQKILRVTFDNSDYYKPLTPSTVSYEKSMIVFFGDSRIKQWNPMPKIEGADTINRGISEETTAQMMLRFKKDVLDIKPNIAIIQAGINDLVAASIADNSLKDKIYNNFINNIGKMLDQAAEQGIEIILLEIIEPYDLGVVRSIIWGNDLSNLVQKANKDLLAFSGKPNLYIFNANKVLHSKEQWIQGVNRDTLHFTEKAYKLLNDEVIKLITTIPK